jgi:very-short-patch-repair endonuclease
VREIACSRDGVVTWAEARAAGFSARAIGIRLERGTWRQLGRVLIIPPHVTSRDGGLAWALHLHSGPESIVTGPVAARLQAWDISGDESVVISPTPVRFPDDWRATVLRRSSPARVERPRLPPLAPAVDALADLLIMRPEAQARHLLDHALQRRWITPEHFDELIVHRSGRGRRGTARLRSLRDRAASGSRSEAEQRMAALLTRVGGTWVPNHTIHDEQGRVLAEIDFAHLELKIAIEVDGRAFHSDRRSFERDRERQNMLVLRGWVVLRFTWERLVHGPDGVIAEVAAALTALRGA